MQSLSGVITLRPTRKHNLPQSGREHMLVHDLAQMPAANTVFKYMLYNRQTQSHAAVAHT